MKKVLLIAALVVAAFSANAQVWIGGAAGFNSGSSKDADGGNLISASEFSFGPEIGYSVNDKIGVGLALHFGTESFKNGTEDKVSASSFSITPFVQYTALELGKFQLIGRVSFGFESATGYGFDEENGGLRVIGDDNFKLSSLGVNITPFLHYVINDKFNVFGAMNFLSLNFINMTAKYNGEEIGTSSVFNLGVDANNVANTGAFQLGFIYKF